jgi:hypothetical protein
VPHVKYAMDYRPRNSFSMSCASRMAIFPGVSELRITGTIWIISTDSPWNCSVSFGYALFIWMCTVSFGLQFGLGLGGGS